MGALEKNQICEYPGHLSSSLSCYAGNQQNSVRITKVYRSALISSDIYLTRDSLIPV